MITLELPNDKQAIIQQASQSMGMNLNDFIINQAYYGSLAVLNRPTTTPQPTESLSHPLLGMYQNIKILGDIIEPVLDEQEWENTNNEWELLK